MQETIETITEWQLETFGLVNMNLVLARGMTETVEVIEIMKNPGRIDIELADVWITVARALVYFGGSDEKLQTLLHNNLYQMNPVPERFVAVALLVDSQVRWLTKLLQMQNGYSVSPDDVHELGLETYWHLVQCANAFGFNQRELMETVDHKMEINRARKWGTKDGVSQHV